MTNQSLMLQQDYSGGKITVRHDGEWIILHVVSGGAETTTSLRRDEASQLALQLSPTVVDRRTKIVRLIREDFDPTPKNYGGHEDWYDNAEEVADQIEALFAEIGSRSR